MKGGPSCQANAGNTRGFFYLEGCWRKSCSPPSVSVPSASAMKLQLPPSSSLPPALNFYGAAPTFHLKLRLPPCGSGGGIGRGAGATVTAAARSLAGHPQHCCELRVRHAANPLARCDSMPCCHRIMCPALRGNTERANAYYYCTSVAAFASRSLLSARSLTLIRRKF